MSSIEQMAVSSVSEMRVQPEVTEKPDIHETRQPLESLVGTKLDAEITNSSIASMGRSVLEYGVSNPFLNGEIMIGSAPEGGLIEEASRGAAGMISNPDVQAGAFEDARMNNLVETMKEMYMESAKTILAWNIVQQVSKDTKIMLQAQ